MTRPDTGIREHVPVGTNLNDTQANVTEAGLTEDKSTDDNGLAELISQNKMKNILRRDALRLAREERRQKAALERKRGEPEEEEV